jgi:hypothetical protein
MSRLPVGCHETPTRDHLPAAVRSQVVIPFVQMLCKPSTLRNPLVKLKSLSQTCVPLALILDAPVAFFELSIQVIIAPPKSSEMSTGLVIVPELGSPD